MAATAPTDFPARINTTADALGAQAERRLNTSSDLLSLCSTLYENTQTGNYIAQSVGFTDEDAEVFSFFLADNTALDDEFRCVGLIHPLLRVCYPPDPRRRPQTE